MNERTENQRATIWKYGRPSSADSAASKILTPTETVNLYSNQGVLVSESFSRSVVTGIETLDGEVEANTQMGMLDAWASLSGNRLILSLPNGEVEEGSKLKTEATAENKNPYLVLHLEHNDITIVAMITTGMVIDAADRILQDVFAQTEKTTSK